MKISYVAVILVAIIVLVLWYSKKLPTAAPSEKQPGFVGPIRPDNTVGSKSENFKPWERLTPKQNADMESNSPFPIEPLDGSYPTEYTGLPDDFKIYVKV